MVILQSLSKTVHLSLALAIILFLGFHFGASDFAFDRDFIVGCLDICFNWNTVDWIALVF